METTLSAVDTLFRDELRDWLADHLVGDFAKARGVGGVCDDERWEVRLEWERELAAGGWLNVSWPVEFGGRGGTATQELVFHIEHARAEAPYWVGVQGRDLFGPTLLEFGSPELRSRFLPRITATEEMWGQGFSEPDAGSDLASLKTRAVLDGDEWIINGQKTWMTFGDHADWMYVLCRTDSAAIKHKGISMLLIPRDQPGVEVRTIRNIAGGEEFCEVFFDEARTQHNMIVGEVNGGWKVVMGTLGNERGGITVLPFQASFEREMRQLMTLVRTRNLGNNPVVRQRMSKAWTGLRVMQLNNDRLLTSVLRGGHPGPESSLGKLHWATWHREFGELMVDMLGPDAMIVQPDTAAARMQRSFLNSRAETIYGGSVEVQKNIIGERVLGLPKE